MFVEGPDDERFFASYFDGTYTRFVKYAIMDKKKVNQFVAAVSHICYADYIFIADSDGMSIEKRKETVVQKYMSISIDKVFVSQREIESWYLAGLNQERSNKYKVRYFDRTDDICKEKFESMVPRGFTPTSFMIEILHCFAINEAISRNLSFSQFHAHYA